MRRTGLCPYLGHALRSPCMVSVSSCVGVNEDVPKPPRDRDMPATRPEEANERRKNGNGPTTGTVLGGFMETNSADFDV